MRRAALLFAIASAGLLGYGALAGVDARASIYTLLGVATIVATTVGVRRHKPSSVTPWYLLAGGILAFVLAGIARAIHGSAIGVENPFPSPADFLGVSGYILLIFGLRALLRSRSLRVDLTTTLDARPW